MGDEVSDLDVKLGYLENKIFKSKILILTMFL